MFSLLALTGGGMSLECEVSDIPRLKEAIRAEYGHAKVDRQAVHIDYTFGGATFIFQNEWDDPCLISSSETGASVLKHLYATLSPSKGESS